MMKIPKEIFLGDLYQIEQCYARAFKMAHDTTGKTNVTPREKAQQMQMNAMVMDLIMNIIDRYNIDIKWEVECHGDAVPFPARLRFDQAVIEWNKMCHIEGDHAVPQGDENEIPYSTKSSLHTGVRV